MSSLYKKLFKSKKKELKCKMCDKKLKDDIRRLKCGHKYHGDCVDLYVNKYSLYSCWKCGKNHS